jgi:hypothetical protein
LHWSSRLIAVSSKGGPGSWEAIKLEDQNYPQITQITQIKLKAEGSKLNQCVALELKAHSCKLKGWAGKLGGYKAEGSKLSADYADYADM